MVDYGLLPPEINSGRIYTGPGSSPLLAAAAAWSGLAGDLQAAAAGHRTVITELTSGPWLGPSSAALVSAVTPFITWLDASSEESAQAATQAYAAAAAFETAFGASIPPPVIAANRALLAVLVATNFFGQNTAAIAATEAVYAEFWAQDAAAMYTYAGSSAAAAELAELPQPAEVTDPYAVLDQAITAFKAQYSNVYNNVLNAASQVNPRVADVLRTLSQPLNIWTTTNQFVNGTSPFDSFLVANTPLDDLVAGYSKYLSPYVAALTAVFQSGQAFGQASSAPVAIANFVAPAGKAAEGAAQAAGSAASKLGASLGSNLGNVAAGAGRAASVGGLSVPASWTSVNAPTTPGVAALTHATAVPAAAEGAVAGNTPVAPPFGQFINGGNGRKTPSYGFRLKFMTSSPAAG